MNKYYVYSHIRLDKNEPFYIGIGTKYNNYEKEYTRAFSIKNRNKIWKSIVSRTKYNVEILFESDDLNKVKQKEIEFIALYKRIIDNGSLSNLTIGGESALGLKHTIETRKRISQKITKTLINNKRRLGTKHSTETKLLMSNSRLNKLNCKKVIDTKTGEIFDSIKKASEIYGIKHTTLNAQLSGQNKNKTNLKYY